MLGPSAVSGGGSEHYGCAPGQACVGCFGRRAPLGPVGIVTFGFITITKSAAAGDGHVCIGNLYTELQR